LRINGFTDRLKLCTYGSTDTDSWTDVIPSITTTALSRYTNSWALGVCS